MKHWTDEDIEFLIDMLEEPRRAWYAAFELWATMRKRPLDLASLNRISAMLGVLRPDRYFYTDPIGMSLLAHAQDLKERHKGELAGVLDGPHQVWYAQGEVFLTLLEAQEYDDFVKWRRSKYPKKETA